MTEVDNLDNEILELLKTMNSKIDEHSEILKEHTQLLGALKHASEVHKAEIDRANIALPELKEKLRE